MTRDLEEQRPADDTELPQSHGLWGRVIALVGPALVASALGLILLLFADLKSNLGAGGGDLRASQTRWFVGSVAALVVLGLSGIPLYIASSSEGVKARRWYKVGLSVVAIGLVLSLALITTFLGAR